MGVLDRLFGPTKNTIEESKEKGFDTYSRKELNEIRDIALRDLKNINNRYPEGSKAPERKYDDSIGDYEDYLGAMGYKKILLEWLNMYEDYTGTPLAIKGLRDEVTANCDPESVDFNTLELKDLSSTLDALLPDWRKIPEILLLFNIIKDGDIVADEIQSLLPNLDKIKEKIIGCKSLDDASAEYIILIGLVGRLESIYEGDKNIPRCPELEKFFAEVLEGMRVVVDDATSKLREVIEVDKLSLDEKLELYRKYQNNGREATRIRIVRSIYESEIESKGYLFVLCDGNYVVTDKDGNKIVTPEMIKVLNRITFYDWQKFEISDTLKRNDLDKKENLTYKDIITDLILRYKLSDEKGEPYRYEDIASDSGKREELCAKIGEELKDITDKSACGAEMDCLENIQKKRDLTFLFNYLQNPHVYRPENIKTSQEVTMKIRLLEEGKIDVLIPGEYNPDGTPKTRPVPVKDLCDKKGYAEKILGNKYGGTLLLIGGIAAFAGIFIDKMRPAFWGFLGVLGLAALDEGVLKDFYNNCNDPKNTPAPGGGEKDKKNPDLRDGSETGEEDRKLNDTLSGIDLKYRDVCKTIFINNIIEREQSKEFIETDILLEIIKQLTKHEFFKSIEIEKLEDFVIRGKGSIDDFFNGKRPKIVISTGEKALIGDKELSLFLKLLLQERDTGDTTIGDLFTRHDEVGHGGGSERDDDAGSDRDSGSESGRDTRRKLSESCGRASDCCEKAWEYVPEILTSTIGFERPAEPWNLGNLGQIRRNLDLNLSKLYKYFNITPGDNVKNYISNNTMTNIDTFLRIGEADVENLITNIERSLLPDNLTLEEQYLLGVFMYYYIKVQDITKIPADGTDSFPVDGSKPVADTGADYTDTIEPVLAMDYATIDYERILLTYENHKIGDIISDFTVFFGRYGTPLIVSEESRKKFETETTFRSVDGTNGDKLDEAFLRFCDENGLVCEFRDNGIHVFTKEEIMGEGDRVVLKRRNIMIYDKVRESLPDIGSYASLEVDGDKVRAKLNVGLQPNRFFTIPHYTEYMGEVDNKENLDIFGINNGTIPDNLDSITVLPEKIIEKFNNFFTYMSYLDHYVSMKGEKFQAIGLELDSDQIKFGGEVIATNKRIDNGMGESIVKIEEVMNRIRQEAEVKRQAEAERPRQEAERQRQEAERQAEAERQRQEAERQAEAEKKRQEAERQAEAERQRQEPERQAEAERQRQEPERQAEAERKADTQGATETTFTRAVSQINVKDGASAEDISNALTPYAEVPNILASSPDFAKEILENLFYRILRPGNTMNEAVFKRMIGNQLDPKPSDEMVRELWEVYNK